MFKGLSRRKIFYTKCSSGNYFRKQDFVVYLTSLLPPSTFFIFFSEVLIQFMDNAGFLICGVTWKPTLLNHSKKCFFHFLSNFGCGFLRRFWFLSYLIFWISWNLWWAAIYQMCKTSFCYNCSTFNSNCSSYSCYNFYQNSVFLKYFIIVLAWGFVIKLEYFF